MPRKRIRPWLLGLVAACTLVSVGTTGAATIPVACGDEAALISAITTANGDAAPDTIQLGAGCTYTFTSADNSWFGPNALPAIASEIVIDGNGAVIERDATAGKMRLFFVGADPAAAATLNYTTGRRHPDAALSVETPDESELRSRTPPY